MQSAMARFFYKKTSSFLEDEKSRLKAREDIDWMKTLVDREN